MAVASPEQAVQEQTQVSKKPDVVEAKRRPSVCEVERGILGRWSVSVRNN